MTVAALPATVTYLEDGVTVRFPAPFRFKSARALVVERIGTDGTIVALQLGVDYTVTGGATDAGGTVTRTAATAGATLRIRRWTERAQAMTYTTGDRFPATSHEEALDQLMLVSQEQDAQQEDTRDRALMVPPGEKSFDLPIASERADAVLSWDQNGQPIAKAIGSFPVGPSGPANSTYTSVGAMAAADASNRSYNLAPEAGVDGGVEAGLFMYQEGDLRGRPDVVQREGVPLSRGGLVPPSANAFWLRAPGRGAVPVQVGQVLLNWRLIESYGAVGDGVTDDTAAFENAFAAIPAGGELHLMRGKRYAVRRTLIPLKPIRIVGGAREQCEILFKANGNFLDVGAAGRAGLLLLHPNTKNIVGYDGKVITANAIRTEIDGVSFIAESGMPAGTHGILMTAPVYLTSCDVKSFTGDGFLVQAGSDQLTTGNANGCTFTNCISQYNGGGGFVLRGNDANACFLLGCRAPSNGTWGLFDDSLLGNVYVQCEADNNRIGGYFATNEKPCRSLYLGCYSETPTHFQLGSRCMLLAPQGLGNPDAVVGAAAISGLPSGDMYFNSGLVGAASEAVANVLGGAIDPGRAIRLSWDDGLQWRMRPGQGLTGLTSQDGENYATLAVDGMRAMLLPVRNVAANIARARPWYPNGFAVGSGNAAVAGSGTGPPTEGSFALGAQVWNDAPAQGGYVGWICVTAGSPGVWRPFGKID